MPNSVVNPAPLTITGQDVSKIYGATLTNTNTSTAFMATGLKNSEKVGNATISYGPGAEAGAAMGTYVSSISPSSATGGTFNSGNYTITYVSGNIIVSPAPLTITADNKTKVFGTQNPALTVSYKGFVNNEGPDQLTSQPVINTEATISSVPGEFPITVNGASANNYAITYVDGTLTITPAFINVSIPNTFTPNGDGINDVWNIGALSNYPQCTVSIFARNGNVIFRSKGYPKAWDGTYKGSPVPTGTYYYVIDLQAEQQTLSGYVTVLR
jgi:gliding motility-associated-like protein